MGNVISVISVCVAAVALIFTIIKFGGEHRKSTDAEKAERQAQATKEREDNIKINLKLDSLCASTNSILVKLERQTDEIQTLRTDIAVLRNRVERLEEKE